MIIDMRTALPPQNESQTDVEARFEEAMACVDAAVIVGRHCERLGVASENERIASFVRGDRDRRIGFAAINPLADSAPDELEKAVDAGLSGVAIAPADQGFRPTHERCFELMARCAERNLPVLVANPMLRHPHSQLEFASPALLDEIVRELPELTVILGDFARVFLEETLLMVAKHKRVYAEISGSVLRPWTLYTAMLAAFERGVLAKLLFGSGFPEESPEAAIERIYTINALRGGTDLPAVPREALRSIVERNALACIGIDRELAERARGGEQREAVAAGAPRLTGDAD